MRSHHFAAALLPEGWARQVRVTVSDGVFESVVANAAPEPDDARHAAAIPGLPNLHSHAFQRGMAGMAERRGPTSDSFWTWREVMYRFVDRVGPSELEAIAALAYMEMLESGSTRVGEFHYLHNDVDGRRFADPAEMARAIAAAAETTGIALTLLPVFYAHAGFGGADPTAGQRRFVSHLDTYSELLDASRRAIAALPDAVLGVAPHSLRAASPAELAQVVALAPNAPVHIHVAEQMREVQDCLAWSGARPVEWLLANAAVDPHWCLVHATHMTEAETAALAATGAIVGLCPITEANLGDGLFPAAGFRAAGGRFGIGSDSNVLIDAAEELRTLEYGQRLARHERNCLCDPQASTGATLFGQARAGGDAALGAPSGLVAGRPADFVTLDTAHPSLLAQPGDALLDAWIFAAGRTGIDGVWRRGTQLVAQGRHHARPAILARYRDARHRLMA